MNATTALDSPTEEDREHDYAIYCGEEFVGYLDNGAEGAKGTDGDGCSVAEVTEADVGYSDYALKVTCGSSVSYLKNGEKGEAGEDGLAGSSGSQGEPGSDGTSCWTQESGDGNYYEILCGTSSSSSLSGRFPKAMCGTTAYNPATHFCDIANSYIVAPICSGNTYNAVTHYCAQNGSGTVIGVNALLLDERDGKTYKTIEIGSQVWMAENLNFAPESGNFWCYSGDGDKCATYGQLYNWSTANAVCPSGWHLPSDGEWYALAGVVGSTTTGTKLKAASGWNGSGNGTDDYGFSALPGGYRYSGDGSFRDVGNNGYQWSTTANGASRAYYRVLYSIADLGRNNNYKEYGFSVRCVLD